MSETSIVRGCTVISTAGRDEGRIFLVLDVTADGNYAVITDGKLRKVEKPKTKKMKHLRFCAATAGDRLTAKVISGIRPEN
ncbi:MAG: RNA-binding protein, partial [Eubacteriales bacterium]